MLYWQGLVVEPLEERLTESLLVNSLWEFRHEDGPVATHRLSFQPNGGIGNYDHPNERRWKIEDNTLLFFCEEGDVTAQLKIDRIENQQFVLLGRHIPNPSIIFRLTQQLTKWPKRPGTKVALKRQIEEFGWEVGDHTYGVPTFVDADYDLAKVKIGKYTSIAERVLITLANHRIDTVSSYPFVVLAAYWPSAPLDISDHSTKGDIVIGNDVWIGADAFISSGVKIGDGAVIGAKAVVTKNVPAYAVVVGNPAKIVKFRFSEKNIEALIRIAWWEWPDELVDSYLPSILSPDVEEFIAAASAITELI